MTGGNRVAKAAPDGYTAGLGTVGSHAFNQTLYKKPLYHAADRLRAGRHDRRPAAASRGAQGPAGQRTSRSSSPTPRRTRARCSTARPASAPPTHLGCLVFNAAIGVDITHIPYQRRRAGDDRPDRRADRLLVPVQHHGDAADQGRHRQADRAARRCSASTCCRTCRPPTSRALANFEAIDLERAVPAQGHAARHRAEAPQRRGPGGRYRCRTAAAQRARHVDRGTRPALAGVPRQVHSRRDREMGSADQGQRHQCR